MKTLQFLNAMLVALVMGVFWGTWFSLSRSISLIDPETFLEVGRIMIENLAGPMRILLPASILSALPVLYGLYRRRESVGLGLAATGLVLMLGALVVTLTVNVPLDYVFREWTVATLPPDWQVVRDRWGFYHGLRTLLSVAALAAFVGSALVSRRMSG